MNRPVKRAALITGASGGIGAALCSAFASAGYQVIATDWIAPQQTIADCTHVSIDLNQLCMDGHARSAAIAQLRNTLGDSKLSVLVNNAALQIVKPTEKLTSDDWSRTLNINLVAPFLLTQAFSPELEKANGSVINISSIHATLTKPEFVAYATSKAALVGLTRSLAVDLGGRIRINAICPAAIATPMLLAGFANNTDSFVKLSEYHPSQCIGSPEDVAQAALYLASSNSSFLNGAIIGLDGGIASRLHDPSEVG